MSRNPFSDDEQVTLLYYFSNQFSAFLHVIEELANQINQTKILKE